jgi:glycosyltransferase involved in cell wall biosynthesis
MSSAEMTAEGPLLRVASQLLTLPARLPSGERLENATVPRRGRPFLEALRLFVHSLRRDAVILHVPTQELFILCALRLLFPFGRARVVAVDLIQTRPGTSPWQHVQAWLKRVLLGRVDLFLLHQKDISGLQECYGIPSHKVRYIPYKVNSWETVRAMNPPEGDYVFSGGRSRRDYTTFCEALRELDCPAVLLTPRPEENRLHETYFQAENLPPHLRVVHDDGSASSWIDHMARARIVVICVSPSSISPSGVGTFILAMALKKCVIITESPATRGVLEHERNAILIPMGDAAALREAVRRAWHDDSYRRRIAAGGHAYAMSLGGAETLQRNIASAIADLLRSRQIRPAGCPSDRHSLQLAVAE